jgi:hypothetical protein
MKYHDCAKSQTPIKITIVYSITCPDTSGIYLRLFRMTTKKKLAMRSHELIRKIN